MRWRRLSVCMQTDTISQAEAAALLNVITCSAANVSTAIVVRLVDATEVSMISRDGAHIENSVRPLPPKHLGIFADGSLRGRRIAHPALQLGGASITRSFGGTRLCAPGKTQRGAPLRRAYRAGSDAALLTDKRDVDDDVLRNSARLIGIFLPHSANTCAKGGPALHSAAFANFREQLRRA